MAMIKCKECGSDVSSKAVKCPHCGSPPQTMLKQQLGCAGFLVVFVIIFIFGALIYGLFFESSLPPLESKKTKTTESQNVKAKENKPEDVSPSDHLREAKKAIDLHQYDRAKEHLNNIPPNSPESDAKYDLMVEIARLQSQRAQTKKVPEIKMKENTSKIPKDSNIITTANENITRKSSGGLIADTVENSPAWLTEEWINDLTQFRAGNDRDSFDTYFKLERCILLKGNLTVTVMKSPGMFGGKTQFAHKGLKLWTYREGLRNYRTE